ncbi:MAG: PilZ domain-containing protein [Oligoflexus sp.]|jgi:hypothetical protein
MSEQVWYLYQNGQQTGPFDTQQVSQIFHSNMIAKDGYIFKVGWKDWRPVEEGYEALGLINPDKKTMTPEEEQAHIERRLKAAPRATISGRVVVHNNGQLTIGQGVNISVDGIFVETSQQLFTVGENLKLSVRAQGMPQAFNAEAVVIRVNDDKRFPVGYGLRFSKIDSRSKESIKRLVNEANNRGDSGRFAAK